MPFPTPLFALSSPSGFEWVIILFIILLLFGGTKLPSLARGLGLSIKEFKKASREDDDEKPAADAPKSAETKKPGNDAPTHGAN